MKGTGCSFAPFGEVVDFDDATKHEEAGFVIDAHWFAKLSSVSERAKTIAGPYRRLEQRRRARHSQLYYLQSNAPFLGELTSGIALRFTLS